jgi:hypothetical protein
MLQGDKIANSLEADYRDALPVNMYAVERQLLGAAGYMLSYPGLTQLGTGEGIDRGAIYNERFSDQYRLSGTELVSVDASGNTSVLGSITGTDQATLSAYSFNTQCVVAGGNAYLYSPVDGFSKITDTDIGTPIDVVWTSPGFYFFTDGEYLYHTDLASESSINPLSFATAEFMPDKSLGLSLNAENKIMVWGRDSLEYFVYNAQATGFAFTRLETRAQKIGIVATHAKCEVGGKFYITGGRKDDAVSVHIIGTGSAQKISTREIDKILKQYTEPGLSNMRMEGRTEDNIAFILIHLPNETLCFNENVALKFGIGKAWTILKSDVYGNTPYRAINGVNDARSSKWVYGDKQADTIGYLDNNTCTHYDEISEWLIYGPFLRLETLSMDQIEIETIPGHTLTEDAKVALSFSYDGLTYGHEEWLEYGNVNEYDKRFFARALGYVPDWVGFKLRGATRSRMAFLNFKLTYS